ncbi:MAG: glycosyltransferase, partial [Actinobacteria bacterium]|nr:glycosyltransferase [Actinomycetota bacterium]
DLSAEPREIDVPLPPELARSATPVIQNAGTLILRDGSGRDRGALVRGTEVFQEDDEGQYDRREEVFAGCGAALLLRKAMLEDVGIFDDDFFMYYEDMDLSWRMRRRGWKVVYVPDAVVRHVHAASSVEWSPLFLFHVERNRLLMLSKNAPLKLAISEHARYLTSVALNLGRYGRSRIFSAPDRAAVGARVRIQLRVVASLLRLLPGTVAKRRALARREAVPSAKLLDWMVAG